MSVNNKGYITILVLVFSAVFLIIFSGTMGFFVTQLSFQNKRIARDQAFQIAEAGVNYYRWFLSHNPDDLQDGTGGAGPYEHDYSDPEGGTVGKFSLQVSGNTACNTVTSVDITSTGWVDAEPSLTQTVKVRYARPSVAEFSYIIDDNVWAGSDRDIKGKYHSNGGIKMDGSNDSLVTSGVASWLCTSSFGCNPDQTVNGVFGSGGGSALWQYPVEPIDFVGLTLDLVGMKAMATSSGFYLPPSGQGYHIIFKNDGTFDVYQINSLSPRLSYSSDLGWHWSYEVINSETLQGNYNIPPSCSVIFVEDDLWVEGVIKGKVTIASADLTNPGVDTSVWLQEDITYTTLDGSDGLLVIGEENVLIGLESDDNLELRGIFMAQNGHFGRNHYPSSWYPTWYDRASLKITGSIVSNGRVGTKWGYSDGSFASGYRNRENSYDRKLMTSPPPLTPFSDDEYTFVKWEEVN